MKFNEVAIKDQKIYDALSSMLATVGIEKSADELVDVVQGLSVTDLTLLFKAIEDADMDDVKALLGDLTEYKSPSFKMGDRDPGGDTGRYSRDAIQPQKYYSQKNIVAGGKKAVTGGGYNDGDMTVEPNQPIDRADNPDYATITTSTGDQKTIQSPVAIARVKRLAGLR